ncbi:unnamed protein product [Meloidogyne enterolobii]|uniref:Uncharacterized protein n=1 Tax=Meloidogyne enterolobii TaxID=390850 RepID=A0ACB1AIL7_MELEN
MNDAVEMLYKNSYRLALSSEQTLKGFGDNYEKVEQLKVEIDKEIAGISSKYGLSVEKGDIKKNGFSSTRRYLKKIRKLDDDLYALLKTEKRNQVRNELKIDRKELQSYKDSLKNLYEIEKLGNDLLESDKFYKNTIFGYLKRIEKEERKIDSEKFLNESFDSKGSSFGFGGTSKGSSSFGSVGETSGSDSSGRILPTLKIKADSSLKSCGSSNSNSPRLWFSTLCASKKQTVESLRKNSTNIKGYF